MRLQYLSLIWKSILRGALFFEWQQPGIHFTPATVELTDNCSYSLLDVKGKVADIIVSTPSKGSPENCLLCVFGQATPAPTSDNWIARLSFDTAPF